MSAHAFLSTRPKLRALAAASAAGALVSLSGTTPAFAATAADGDVDVVNTETVQVYLSAEGDIETRRVYEQLVMSGKGTVDIENPVSEDGLRNLDGFSGFTVKDGQQVAEFEVDGVERARSVSDYDGALPLDIDVDYKLDGKDVKPGDVVGESGELEVEFTVENVTDVTQEVTIPDGKGGTITKTVEVPLPIVGSLSTVAPDSFTNVASQQANMAGDGKGGTKLSFTMTLFPPIGTTTSTFGYTADIENGVVPRIDVTALPVNPLRSPSFKTAATSYQGGADTGTQLAAGATEIDTNLLKLRDGAGDLLAGLLKLHAGSEELESGLADTAAPGAKKLATGAADLKDGLGKLDDGAGRLSAGLLEVDSKAPRLITGLGDLRAGLVQVDEGLAKLYAGVGSVRTNPDYLKLVAGREKMLAGGGTKDQAGSLTWAVDQVRAGLSGALPKIEQMAAGVYNNSATAPGAYQSLGCAVQVINLLSSGAGNAANPCFADFSGVVGMVGAEANPIRKAVLDGLSTKLQQSLPKLATPDGATNQTTLYGGLKTLLAQLSSQDPNSPGAVLALSTVECALDNTSLGGLCAAVRPGEAGLRQGLGQVVAGVPQLVNTIIATVQGGVGRASDTSADETLRGGMSSIIDGTDLIRSKGGDLVDGLSQLSDGAGQLSDGTGQARDGSGLIADGSAKLSDGLGDAAEGSGRLADGLGEAASGAPKLVDGAGRLSKEGTQVIAGKGAATAQNYGELYAVLEAGAQRADAEKMAFGAPEGATGLTAYNYIIKGEDGEGGRNWARGVAGLGLLATGFGVFAVRRRLI